MGNYFSSFLLPPHPFRDTFFQFLADILCETVEGRTVEGEGGTGAQLLFHRLHQIPGCNQGGAEREVAFRLTVRSFGLGVRGLGYEFRVGAFEGKVGLGSSCYIGAVVRGSVGKGKGLIRTS